MTRAVHVAQFGWSGMVTVRRFVAGREVEVVTFPNLIHDGGLDLLAGGLAGGDDAIKYVALDTDDTPPATGDVVLGAEAARFAVDEQSEQGTGVQFTRVYLDDVEADGIQIAKIGWFGGPDATAAADSGVLIASVLYAHHKGDAGPESLYIDRTDTIVRG